MKLLTNRRGFSLLELVIVMFLLVVFMGMFAALIWGSVRVQRQDAAVFNRVLSQSALADRFRADVARARQSPEKLDAHVAGPTCLILQLPEGHHLIYRWTDNKLRLLEVSKDAEVQQEFPVGEDRIVEFRRAGNLLTLRVSTPMVPGQRRPSAFLEIVAALGGDWR